MIKPDPAHIILWVRNLWWRLRGVEGDQSCVDCGRIITPNSAHWDHEDNALCERCWAILERAMAADIEAALYDRTREAHEAEESDKRHKDKFER